VGFTEFTWFYLVSPGLTGFYRVIPGLLWFYLVLRRFQRVSKGSSG